MKIKFVALIALIALFSISCTTDKSESLDGTKWVSKHYSRRTLLVLEFTSTSSFKEYYTDSEGNGEANVRYGSYNYGTMATFNCVGWKNPPRIGIIDDNVLFVTYENGEEGVFCESATVCD